MKPGPQIQIENLERQIWALEKQLKKPHSITKRTWFVQRIAYYREKLHRLLPLVRRK